ncbi:MAG: dihydrofolate reductase [Granulosicoccus sp.]
MPNDVAPAIAMIMAMDKNKLIGQNGGLPWKIPGELAYFKRVTMGKPVVMGRKTFDSIGKPLPGRTNIVVTRNTEWSAEGVVVVNSLNDAIAASHDALNGQPAGEIMIIGGASLCRDAMSITRRLYLTVVDRAYEGDTWLCSFNWGDWTIVSEDKQSLEDTGGVPVTYWVLEK